MLLMAPEVATFSDVTLLMLSQHGIVKVKDDNSMIISEYLMEIMSLENLEESLPYDAALLKDSPGTAKFIQTCFQDSIIKKEETTWEPIEGLVKSPYYGPITLLQNDLYSAEVILWPWSHITKDVEFLQPPTLECCISRKSSNKYADFSLKPLERKWEIKRQASSCFVTTLARSWSIRRN
ncbi:hypothetical protein C7M61_001876 [Candidozyma pseudohaemuli]|uniref:Uncharacterized protein n=1 Tax=Candidozyma pseudohaemuli TaxID=418784 RepID=A0A2P7YTJ7_9ASCO|nr:hypothetical protein C7M61_001876 [[Candida] pseudohaemulonii]PSK39271.1 hypothetical protein C7M61_001876 [[Candida] pseudohaemulonii]